MSDERGEPTNERVEWIAEMCAQLSPEQQDALTDRLLDQWGTGDMRARIATLEAENTRLRSVIVHRAHDEWCPAYEWGGTRPACRCGADERNAKIDAALAQ